MILQYCNFTEGIVDLIYSLLSDTLKERLVNGFTFLLTIVNYLILKKAGKDEKYMKYTLWVYFVLTVISIKDCFLFEEMKTDFNQS